MSRTFRKTSTLKEEGRQFRVLFRHFFRRLFQNDIVSLEDQMMEKLVATLSALLHTFFTFGISLILLEILLWNFKKIPFACSYLPGKAKIHIFASLYFLAFLVYTASLSSLAKRLLNSPVNFLIYLSMVCLLFYFMRYTQNRSSVRFCSLQFEEKPESMVSLFARSE